MLTAPKVAPSTSSLPAGCGVELVQSGVRWDAVRAPESVGELVLAMLADDSGALVHDPFTRCVYWFVHLGSGNEWTFPETTGIQVLGNTSWVAIPPLAWIGIPGLRWARPAGGERFLTNPGQLHEALVGAVGSRVAVAR